MCKSEKKNYGQQKAKEKKWNIEYVMIQMKKHFLSLAFYIMELRNKYELSDFAVLYRIMHKAIILKMLNKIWFKL